MKCCGTTEQDQKQCNHQCHQKSRHQKPHIRFKVAVHIIPICKKEYHRKNRDTDLVKCILKHIQSKALGMLYTILSQI